MSITIIPIWKLQTKLQMGISLGFTISLYDSLADYITYELDIDLIFTRITINFKLKSNE